MWDYTVEVADGDDLKGKVMGLAEAYRDKYPGAAKEHAIADMPLVEAAADAAVAFLAVLADPGETFRVTVAGSSKHEAEEYAAVSVRKVASDAVPD